MRYLGGKSRIANEISGVIHSELYGRKIEDSCGNLRNNSGGENNGKNFVSLFCGSCAIESKIGFDRIICNDNNKYLIAMWNAIKHGYELPDIVSEDEYRYIRMHKDNDPALTGFVGFACSFGGKFFGGYARNRQHDTNFAARAKRSLINDIQSLQRAEFICGDYRDVEIPAGAVVYADPPYQGTTSYTTGRFNSDEFWQYMRELSKNHKVFISEQNAPSDFICIWEKPLRRTIDVNKSNNFYATEKLFTI